jgi:hypothetical protein
LPGQFFVATGCLSCDAFLSVKRAGTLAGRLENNLTSLESEAACGKRPPTQAGHEQETAPVFENAGCVRRLVSQLSGRSVGQMPAQLGMARRALIPNSEKENERHSLPRARLGVTSKYYPPAPRGQFVCRGFLCAVRDFPPETHAPWNKPCVRFQFQDQG